MDNLTTTCPNRLSLQSSFIDIGDNISNTLLPFYVMVLNINNIIVYFIFRLMNTLNPGSVKKINKSKLAFKQVTTGYIVLQHVYMIQYTTTTTKSAVPDLHRNLQIGLHIPRLIAIIM